MRVEKEYKKAGYFWLPENEGAKIPGTLTIHDGGKIKLEVVGHFKGIAETFNGNGFYPRIIGEIEEDGLVTLEKCRYSVCNFSTSCVSKSELRCSTVLSGAAWGKDEELTFNTVSFSVDCLEEWVGVSCVYVESNIEEKTTNIACQIPDDLRFSLPNGLTFVIGFGYTAPLFAVQTEARIKHNTKIRLESENALPLSEFITVIHRVTNFLCFAMDEVVTIKNVTATTSELEEDISIFYESLPYVEKVPQKKHWEMLFNFSAIMGNPEAVLNNWLKAYEKIAPTLDLYFSMKVGAQKYLEGKFLALVQGLETYHRRTSNEVLFEPSKYEELVETVIKACPNDPDQVKWLKGRLAFGNEINLSTRMKRIIEPYKQEFGSSRERKSLVRKIVNTRNYFTHYSESLKDKAASGRELWTLCLILEGCYNLHFLKVLGFTDEEISNVIKNSSSLSRKLRGAY